MKTKNPTVSNKRVASSVQASMEFEGLKPSAHAKKLGEDYLDGKISSCHAREKIRARHASRFGK